MQPDIFYQNRIQSSDTHIHGLKRSGMFMLYGKLLTFLAAVALCFFYYGKYDWIFGALLAASILLYILCLVRDERLKRRIQFFRRCREICQNELRALQGDFSAFACGEQYVNPHHEYTYDLDVFGAHSLFNRLNRTITQEGSGKLAEKFQYLPVDENTVTENQEAIRELMNLSDFRIDFQANGPIQSRFDKLDADALKPYRFFKSPYFKCTYILIIITWIALLLTPFVAGAGSWLGLLAIVQLLLTVTQIKPTNIAVRQIDKLQKEIKNYQSLLECIQRNDFQSNKLKRLHEFLFIGTENCPTAFHQLNRIINLLDQRNGMAYPLFNGLILSDVRAVRQFIYWQEKYAANLAQWTNSLAEMDALISLSTYGYNHPHNVFPELLKETDAHLVEAKQVYHPFLAYDKAVANDFTMDKKNIYIVTGANMAGKSTFLRTVGVNYMLAANGCPVCAQVFRFCLVSLFSSMRTSDNLAENISYFNAELLRLEQLITYCKRQKHTLIILDEILKGTNSKDKLQGSILFLQKVQALPVTVIVATHDLELAKLGDEYAHFHNHSFEFELGEDIRYTYKIKDGVAQNLNATYLLQNLLKKI